MIVTPTYQGTVEDVLASRGFGFVKATMAIQTFIFTARTWRMAQRGISRCAASECGSKSIRLRWGSGP
jgi:hypothetical protein